MCYKLDSVEGVEMLQRAYSKLDNEFLKERRFKEHNATERNPYHRDLQEFYILHHSEDYKGKCRF